MDGIVDTAIEVAMCNRYYHLREASRRKARSPW